MYSFKLIVFSVLFAFICGDKARFDNYRVYSIKIQNESQLEVLQALENSQDGISYIEAPINVKRPAEMIVPPHKFADISEFFGKFDIEHEVKIDNLQRLIDEEQPKYTTRGTFGWEKYYDLTDIYTWLDQLLEQNPNILTNYNFGVSYENRTIRAIKLSKKKAWIVIAGNPAIFIESTIHAREWVSAAVSTYILNELLTTSDPEIREMSENYDWIFVPVVNVDGYQYTHTDNRMWRKTRQPHFTSFFLCWGADPNRNFDFHHAEVGSSTNPCSEVYAGPSPFSEPEIRSLADFIKTVDNLKMYISFHSYSQLILFPNGYTNELAPNHNDLNIIGTKGKEAIRKRYGTDYSVGNIADTIYLASGSSIDWVYGTRNVPLAYTFELRDKGHYGFILPSKQIIPNSLEVLDGLKAMVKGAKLLKYL